VTSTWVAVLVATAGCYAFKLAGQSLPRSVLERPLVQEIADPLPIALLSALVVTNTFAVGTSLVLDARAVGLAAAVAALLLRAPFIVVVLAATAAAAAARALGWAV
jgi:hypothetical protein